MAISTKLATAIAALNGYGTKVSTASNKWTASAGQLQEMPLAFAQPDQPLAFYYDAFAKPGRSNLGPEIFIIDTQAVFDVYRDNPTPVWEGGVQYFVIRESGETWKCTTAAGSNTWESLGNYRTLDVIPAGRFYRGVAAGTGIYYSLSGALMPLTA